MSSPEVRRRSHKRALWFGLLAWGASFLLALRIGASSDPGYEIIAQLRLPRALLASAVGMSLATAGAVLQALFSNPLCEPYTLGISSGSALGAVLGVTFGFPLAVGGIVGSAFGGALGFMIVLYLISMRSKQGNLPLLLAGVMLGFFGSSLVTLWTAFADPNGVQGAMFWLLGDLSRARMSGATVSAGFSLVMLLMILRNRRELDALLLGEEAALTMGVDVPRVRRRLILLCSLLIAMSVSASGMIGFVGLVVPHFARRWVGSLHRELIPLSAIWGATALVLADSLARVVAKPYELPVGAVTAVIGAPVFAWVMLQRREFAG